MEGPRERRSGGGEKKKSNLWMNKQAVFINNANFVVRLRGGQRRSAGSLLRSRLKCFNIYWMDCRDINQTFIVVEITAKLMTTPSVFSVFGVIKC